MKIIVISDTHGNYPLAIQAVGQAMEADQIFHLGDGVEDARVLEEICEIPVTYVAGNCDFSGDTPLELVVSLGARRIYLTHGHLFGVKNGIQQLYLRASKEKAAVVIYGHTHQAAVEKYADILFVNPGCLKRDHSCPSYAVISIDDDAISAEIVPIQLIS